MIKIKFARDVYHYSCPVRALKGPEIARRLLDSSNSDYIYRSKDYRHIASKDYKKQLSTSFAVFVLYRN